jgi:type I restriction enzyme S subunit
LRFPEFSGEWEVKKLGEVATNKSGKYNPTNETDSIKCIEMEHLATETGQLLGYIDGSTSGSIKNVFNEGDVLFGKLRPYLKKYLQAPFDGVCSSEIWVLKGKNISNDFLYRIVQTNSFIDLANQSSGSKMPRADWNVVENGFFSFPSLSEQQKIASFLSLIDERIQTQSKIIENLKTLIKGTSEKLFTQKLRFKDENGKYFPDWKIKLGGEVFESISNKKHNSDLSILAITQEYGAIPRDLIEYQISVTDKSVESYKVVEIGDFIISLRSFQGGIEYSNYKGICSPAYIILRNKIKIDNRFYKYYLKAESYIKLLNKKLEGIRDGKMISYSYFSEIDLPFPCLQEQTKIANFLSDMDKNIETENLILEQYQKQKQYLLRQMFV